MCSTRGALDSKLKEIQLIEKIDEHCQVWRMVYRYDTIRWSKVKIDYCIIVHWLTYPTGEVIASFGSIEHLGCPPHKKITRGEIFSSGFVIAPRNSKSCTVTFVLQSKFEGLSESVIQSIGHQQCLILAKIRSILTESNFLRRGMTPDLRRSVSFIASKFNRQPSENRSSFSLQ